MERDPIRRDSRFRRGYRPSAARSTGREHASRPVLSPLYGFQMGVNPGVPGVFPAVGPPFALYALSFAFAPAWLLPGRSDVPASGVMAATP
jgi:hypothetical protein